MLSESVSLINAPCLIDDPYENYSNKQGISYFILFNVKFKAKID